MSRHLRRVQTSPDAFTKLQNELLFMSAIRFGGFNMFCSPPLSRNVDYFHMSGMSQRFFGRASCHLLCWQFVAPLAAWVGFVCPVVLTVCASLFVLASCVTPCA